MACGLGERNPGPHRAKATVRGGGLPPASSSLIRERRAARRTAPDDSVVDDRSSGGNYISRWQRAFSRTPHGITGSGGFSHSYATVIQALATYADYDTGENARPGSGRLERDTGLSTSTVARATAWAQSAGWVELVKAAVRGHSVNVYRMTFPPSMAGHL